MTSPDADASDAPTGARRLFFAVPVDATVRGRLEDASIRLQTAARMTPLVATWVPPRNLHLTLHFLGAVAPAAAERLAQRCAQASGPAWTSEKLTARGVGYFPDGRSPRVMWTAVKAPSHAMDDWREALAGLIQAADLEVPTAEFHAHLTLARFKGLRGTGLFVKMAGQFERTVFGAWWAREIHLMQSTLGGPEPVYTPIATIPLAPRDGVEDAARED